MQVAERRRKGVIASVPVERRPAAEIPEAAAPSVGDRVVAEVRHEIGNYFHKLYYWADFLADSRAGHGGDVAATQMLEDTIRGLEDLLRTMLEYVRPIAATPIRMDAREVVDGVLRQLHAGLDGRVGTVTDLAALTGRTVAVDPGRLSQLLATMVRALANVERTGALALSVAVERGAAGDVVVVRIGGVAGAPWRRSTNDEVEWATAENIARVLGGELVGGDGDGEAQVRLALPLRS